MLLIRMLVMSTIITKAMEWQVIIMILLLLEFNSIAYSHTLGSSPSWYMFRNALNHTGCQSEGFGVFARASLAWSCNVGGAVTTEVLVADLDGDGVGEVVAGSFEQEQNVRSWFLSYVDSSGVLRWRYSLIHVYTPTIYDLDNDGYREVVVGSGDEVLCLSHSGSVVWRYALNETISTPPIVLDLNQDGSLEIVIGSPEGVYCVSAFGELQWFSNTTFLAGNAPAAADVNHDRCLEVVVSCTYQVYCISSMGQQLWNRSIEGPILSSPVLVDLNKDGLIEILVGSADHRLYCLNASGFTLWTYTFKDPITTTPAVADLDKDGSYEILVSSNGELFCLTADGRCMWTFDANTALSSPTIADLNNDTLLEVVVGGSDGTVYCVDGGGALLWTFNVGSPITVAPSVADLENDGILEVFVGTLDGDIVCLKGGPSEEFVYGLVFTEYFLQPLITASVLSLIAFLIVACFVYWRIGRYLGERVPLRPSRFLDLLNKRISPQLAAPNWLRILNDIEHLLAGFCYGCASILSVFSLLYLEQYAVVRIPLLLPLLIADAVLSIVILYLIARSLIIYRKGTLSTAIAQSLYTTYAILFEGAPASAILLAVFVSDSRFLPAVFAALISTTALNIIALVSLVKLKQLLHS